MENLVSQTILNRYRVDAFIDRGGMAEVYRAFDQQRQITVALKFLREDFAPPVAAIFGLEPPFLLAQYWSTGFIHARSLRPPTEHRGHKCFH